MTKRNQLTGPKTSLPVPDFLTVEEAAEVLRLSARTLDTTNLLVTAVDRA